MTTGQAHPNRQQQLLEAIHRQCTRPWTLMEVCGGQTHALLRHGIDQRLPEAIRLIHGPGCPVCVTPAERLDQAMALAAQPGVILCSFGDMLRVPGSGQRTLLSVRASGGDVRVIYAPLDVIAIARRHPEQLVVFFAVGFETTAPATAVLAQQALASGLANLALLVCHVRVPPVLASMLEDPSCQVQAILAAGHVCTVTGQRDYEALAARHRVPIVVTGFSAEDLLQGILQAVRQLERGQHRVENGYPRVANDNGNPAAQLLVNQVFQPVDTPWRGLGMIPAGGLALRWPYDRLAAERHGLLAPPSREAAHGMGERCLSGEVLRGRLLPPACPSFLSHCTPEHPLGAPMVSSEGACAAYARYHGSRL
ncbi:MAG: hydrogenase formation protein HypD [Cyanobacteriota bacterium]